MTTDSDTKYCVPMSEAGLYSQRSAVKSTEDVTLRTMQKHYHDEKKASEYEAKILLEMANLQACVNNVFDPEWISKNRPFHRAAVIELVEALDWIGGSEVKWWKPTPDQKVKKQFQLELIDVIHFILSQMILDAVKNRKKDLINTRYSPVYTEDSFDSRSLQDVLSSDDFLEDFSRAVGHAEYAMNEYSFQESSDPHIDSYKLIVKNIDRAIVNMSPCECELSTVSRDSSNVTALSRVIFCLKVSGLDITDIFCMYVGKNTLNKFRQEQGDKDGIYNKESWFGYQDNHWLEVFLQETEVRKVAASGDTEALIKIVYEKLKLKYNDVVQGNKEAE